MTLTHWKKLDNPDYIGAYAFQPGEKKTVTIAKVCREEITGVEGKKSEETVVHFRESEKPMILNATNAKMISKHAGTSYIEQWVDVVILLGVEKVKAFGDLVEAVRVQKTKPEQPQQMEEPVPSCKDCGGPIEGAGKVSARRIASASQQQFGAALCVACATKRKAQKADEEDNTNANDENQDQ